MNVHSQFDRMGRIRDFLQKSIFMLFGAVMLYITVLVVFGGRIGYGYKKDFLVSNALLLSIGLLF